MTEEHTRSWRVVKHIPFGVVSSSLEVREGVSYFELPYSKSTIALSDANIRSDIGWKPNPHIHYLTLEIVNQLIKKGYLIEEGRK